jgi:hypothetical protein
MTFRDAAVVSFGPAFLVALPALLAIIAALFTLHRSSRVRVFYGLAREGIALAALRGVDLFRVLTEEEFATLAEHLKTAPFAPGETLTRLKAGDFMGEMALLTGEPRTATCSPAYAAFSR